jgi:hypothetical protein
MTTPVSIHPTTQIMTTTTPVTIEAAGNLLEHDALLQGYRELLEMAKAQLEAFELGEDDWRRLENRMVNRLDYYQLGLRLGSQISRAAQISPEDLAREDEDTRNSYQLMELLVDRLSDTVTKRIQERVIRDEVRAAVSDLKEEIRQDCVIRIENSIERMVNERYSTEFYNARSETDALENLIQRTFGDQFRRLAKEAAAEVANKEAE